MICGGCPKEGIQIKSTNIIICRYNFILVFIDIFIKNRYELLKRRINTNIVRYYIVKNRLLDSFASKQPLLIKIIRIDENIC